MGGVVLGILVWQEGGELVGLLIALGAIALSLLAYWLVRRKREGKLTLLDPDLFRFPHFRIGISQQMLQQITLGGAMIALPIFLQMTLEYNAMQAGLSLAPLSLSMFGVALLAGRKAGNRRPSNIVLVGFALCTLGMASIIPIMPRSESGWALVVPLLITGSGLGLLVSQLNNYTLSPIEEERVSEAAGVNSAAGSFGLSFGLAMAGGIMLAVLSFAFTNMTEASKVIPTAQQQQIANTLEDNARGDEQHAARSVARQRAQGRPSRDPPHQHRREESFPSGGAARSDARQPHWPRQRLPDATPARDHAIDHIRRNGLGLSRGPQEWGRQVVLVAGAVVVLAIVVVVVVVVVLVVVSW